MEREQLISLVTSVQQKEENAAAELFDAFYSDIYYHILKIVNNDSELAADLTQDTFVQILESIDQLEEPAAFVTWSQRIAFSKCTGYFKKKKELLVDEDEDGYSIFDTQVETDVDFIPGEALDKEDLKQTIQAMINALPEEQRSALLLRYFNEISVKEIAEIQGVSEGTVKSRLNYARKAIKASVEEYEKKNDLKLHCAGVIPLLLWFFRAYRRANGMPVTYGVSTAAFQVSASATTASTQAAAGILAKVVGRSIATHIVAGVACVSVLTGGIVLGISCGWNLNANENDFPTENIVIEATRTTEIIAVETTSDIESTLKTFDETLYETIGEETQEEETIDNTYIPENPTEENVDQNVELPPATTEETRDWQEPTDPGTEGGSSGDSPGDTTEEESCSTATEETTVTEGAYPCCHLGYTVCEGWCTCACEHGGDL